MKWKRTKEKKNCSILLHTVEFGVNGNCKPSVLSSSVVLSEIELAASDLVKASVSGKIRLEIDDVPVILASRSKRFGVGGKVLRTELVF